MTVPTIVFLDLEETVIESWDNPLLTNIARIRRWLDSISPDRVGLFSHAVYNQHDLEVFRNSIQKPVERAFGVKFDNSLTVTIEDIINSVREVRGFTATSFNTLDFFDFFDKENSFQHFARAKSNNFSGRILLLDDSVEDTTLTVGDLTIGTVNVNNLY